MAKDEKEITEVAEGEGCFFDKFFGAAKEVLEAAKKPQIRKAIQRKMSAAYDDAENKKIDQEAIIEKERLNFKDYNVNNVIEAQRMIERLTEMQAKIKKEYVFMFGEEMK
ncbi:MAG TPA: hypothetical protein PKL44_00390 [Candidatus Dojkabacteria bacterium]|nr:hypothetical protein [Candidatus Dojkabacteria bacterium]